MRIHATDQYNISNVIYCPPTIFVHSLMNFNHIFGGYISSRSSKSPIVFQRYSSAFEVHARLGTLRTTYYLIVASLRSHIQYLCKRHPKFNENFHAGSLCMFMIKSPITAHTWSPKHTLDKLRSKHRRVTWYASSRRSLLAFIARPTVCYHLITDYRAVWYQLI